MQMGREEFNVVNDEIRNSRQLALSFRPGTGYRVKDTLDREWNGTILYQPQAIVARTGKVELIISWLDTDEETPL